MSRVCVREKYDLPILNNREGRKFTWSVICNELYPNENVSFTPSQMSELIQHLRVHSKSCSFEEFLKKFSYEKFSDFVFVVAKFYGFCFNSDKYTSTEDFLIRILYLFYGKCTNIAVKYMMDLTSETGYDLKSEREIQDRVDYLEKGADFKRKYKDCISFQNQNCMTFTGPLVTFNSPRFRTPYTYAENCLLRLSSTYGVDFLPWKDKEEKNFFAKNKVTPCDLLKDTRDVITNLTSVRHSLIQSLMRKKEFKSADLSWSSDMDALLYDCFDGWNNRVVLDKKTLYKSLLQKGKSIVDCENRRIVLGIRPRRTVSEYNMMFELRDSTPRMIAASSKGLKRTSFSNILFRDKIENYFNKPMHLISDGEWEGYIATIV